MASKASASTAMQQHTPASLKGAPSPVRRKLEDDFSDKKGSKDEDKEKAKEEKDKDKDSPKSEPQTAALRLALATLKAQSPKDDGADVLTQRLAQQAGESFSALMQPIESLVANADSLEALLEQLLELEDQLPIEDYQLLLGQAFTAAELSGRFDVNEGR